MGLSDATDPCQVCPSRGPGCKCCGCDGSPFDRGECDNCLLHSMHWYNSMTCPTYIHADRRGQFGDCYKVYINFDQTPEAISHVSPEEPVISVPICAFTPEGDVINFWGMDLDRWDRRGE